MIRHLVGWFGGLLLMGAGLLLMGVDQCKNEPEPPPATVVKADPAELSYVRDERTNLCFARYRYVIPCGQGCSNGAGFSITGIDCERLKGVATNMVENVK